MTKRFLIFIIPLCFLLFGCVDGVDSELKWYGNLLFEFNDNRDGLIFAGCGTEERLRVLYVPETVYGIPVVGIKGRSDLKSYGVYPPSEKDIYAEKIILPDSVTQIGYKSFYSDNYPSLKTIIIKGIVKDLNEYAFYCGSDSDTLLTLVLLSTTVPPKVSSIYRSEKQNLKFYVPDESVTIYKQADGWSGYASSIYPLGEYKDNL